MKCKECRDYNLCLHEANIYDQIFDPEYDKALCFKPITNADQIRAMSDEELCEFILEIRENGNCLNDRCYATDPNKGCNDCTMEWLKAPHKENEE